LDAHPAKRIPYTLMAEQSNNKNILKSKLTRMVCTYNVTQFINASAKNITGPATNNPVFDANGNIPSLNTNFVASANVATNHPKKLY
jgi:hypothetical protein